MTSQYSNRTQLFSLPSLATDSLRILMLTLVFPTFCVYLLFVIVILTSLSFTRAQMQENVRYHLFCHMLIRDSLQLSVTLFLFLAAIYLVLMPVILCCVLAAISTLAFLVTPYNLALMSLERYIAICHPLRHGEICTIRRCNVAIVTMWAVGSFPVLTELFILAYFADKRFFSLKIICAWKFLERYPVQVVIKYVTYSLSFGIVGITIIYTYIRVMLVARKISSTGSSASKARNTVLIHAFQLLLCLFSLISPFTEAFINYNFIYMTVINFFVFICLPLYISPLVYGMRDEVIKKSIRKVFFRV